MALRSGLPDVVPWALNALSVASFSARPELQLPSLPSLLPALLQVPHYILAALALQGILHREWPQRQPEHANGQACLQRQSQEIQEANGQWTLVCR